MTTKVKRSLVKTFLRTGSVGTPVWALIGDGVTSGKINYNPKVAEETYITEDTAQIYLDSYAPTLPIEATAKYGDPAFDFIDTLRKGRSVLGGSETDIVNVWLYQKDGFTIFPAESQPVSIQIDDFGGEGGAAAKLNYTINFVGAPIAGVFSPAATAEFIAMPIADDVTLTALTLGSGTLTPLFSADHKNLFYTTSIAAATVTVSSTCSGATIVQKCNGTVVGQGGAASLNLGANIITIDVTKTTYHAIYSILATRTV
jgi:hypothetical protein